MSASARGSMIWYGVPGKMTRRLAGVVIGAQGLAVFFGALVARGLAAAEGSQTSGSSLVVGSLLAVLCVLDAGLLRRPWGISVGWSLQIATFSCAFIVPVMALVGLVFGALWLTALVQGAKMDEHTRRVDAQWYAEQEASGPQTPLPQTPGPQTPGPQTPGPQTPDPRAAGRKKPPRDG